MGIFRWLFGRGKRAQPDRWLDEVMVDGDGSFGFNIVGEANYQSQLDSLCGGRTKTGHEMECMAILVEEPTNPFDPNAVAVTIDDLTVGNLARRDAVAFKKALAKAGFTAMPISVEAFIVGGWDRGFSDRGHYGVKLDMCEPYRFFR
ncbi:MAG: hypothetical protein V7704_08105 [Aurantimonas endophytica]|uniref:hypothetical protein n=1 Tax=Aurantimonas endophytica TaxID=1522175 RepID=UPI003003078B